MGKKASKRSASGDGKFKINNYRDLHEMERATLEDYFNHKISRPRAVTIFTGARTMAITAKIILESNHLGVKSIAGMGIDEDSGVIELKNTEAKRIPEKNG